MQAREVISMPRNQCLEDEHGQASPTSLTCRKSPAHYRRFQRDYDVEVFPHSIVHVSRNSSKTIYSSVAPHRPLETINPSSSIVSGESQVSGGWLLYQDTGAQKIDVPTKPTLRINCGETNDSYHFGNNQNINQCRENVSGIDVTGIQW